MADTQQNFPPVTTDPEATLLQPRFDESDAQVAQPVVPLSGAPHSLTRSRLPIALVLVSALLGGLVSVLAYRLYQRAPRQAQPASVQAATQAAQQPAPQATQTPELTAAVPAAEENAPPPQQEAESAPAPDRRAESAAAEEEKAPRAAVAKRDEEDKARDDSKTREERRRDDEPRAVRVAEPRSRKVDVIPSYPDRVVDERDARRVEASDYELPNGPREGRRARRQKRRNIDRIRDIFGAPPPG